MHLRIEKKTAFSVVGISNLWDPVLRTSAYRSALRKTEYGSEEQQDSSSYTHASLLPLSITIKDDASDLYLPPRPAKQTGLVPNRNLPPCPSARPSNSDQGFAAWTRLSLGKPNRDPQMAVIRRLVTHYVAGMTGPGSPVAGCWMPDWPPDDSGLW